MSEVAGECWSPVQTEGRQNTWQAVKGIITWSLGLPVGPARTLIVAVQESLKYPALSRRFNQLILHIFMTLTRFESIAGE